VVCERRVIRKEDVQSLTLLPIDHIGNCT